MATAMRMAFYKNNNCAYGGAPVVVEIVAGPNLTASTEVSSCILSGYYLF